MMLFCARFSPSVHLRAINDKMGTRKSLFITVDKNYYDLRDILACKQNMKFFYIFTIFNLVGQKFPDTEESISRVDLPLFMVESLPSLKVIPPSEFSSIQMQVLQASPEHVNIMHWNQFYFILCKHIAKLIPAMEGRMLSETALYTFLQRSGWVINCGLHLGIKSHKIDCTEEQLYQVSFNSALRFSRWFNSRQTVARKRKSSQLPRN
ncbi:unnamed protein product [Thelazia callipaeda]|uniref:DNA replication complex GINS protein PSF3 n=1 Tax=Thelazia callipaeda TaxID=103827 RepID=A0A0N5D077_THECL|nr:unnamed protein product [Thelazia callipaeda]